MSSNLSDMCGSSSRDDGGSGTGGVSSGDWICGDVTCSHSNFARRQKCKKCRRDRSLERSSSVGSSGSSKKKLGTEIGKAAAEKSRGLFSAEDWQCNKCANVNWARRMTCNMCNAPKFCDVEERTGFGGGYNDRGVVEYKEREESDSEYDEFGRLKKRRKNSNDDSIIKSSSKMENIEDDEEDDEEDGDDDLAKYNLFSDDEEIVPSVKFQNKVISENLKDDVSKYKDDRTKTTSRRSRSRTRSDIKRRQSYSSSGRSTSSSSSSSSATSSSSTSSSTSSSSTDTLSSRSRKINKLDKKRSCSRSRSRSTPRSPLQRQRLSSREGYIRKRSHDKTKSATTEWLGGNSKSRSKSRSSNHSSRSPPSKRNRNPSLSRKHSRSPNSHRKRTTRSRSMTPKRRR